MSWEPWDDIDNPSYKGEYEFDINKGALDIIEGLFSEDSESTIESLKHDIIDYFNGYYAESKVSRAGDYAGNGFYEPDEYITYKATDVEIVDIMPSINTHKPNKFGWRKKRIYFDHSDNFFSYKTFDEWVTAGAGWEGYTIENLKKR